MSQIGRLAFRVEGNWWKAYYALPNTMEDAVFLAQIQMALVQNKERKQVFMKLMQDIVGDLLEGRLGTRPSWPNPPEPAPEHEKTGSA